MLRKSAFWWLIPLFCMLVAQEGLAQGVALRTFHLRSQGSDVLVSWELLNETGIDEFELYRKFDNEGSFRKITSIPADGSGSYVYLDDDMFKDDPKVITYELKVLKNGRTYKFYATLSHNPTAVQRTWGSIKSMFR